MNWKLFWFGNREINNQRRDKLLPLSISFVLGGFTLLLALVFPNNGWVLLVCMTSIALLAELYCKKEISDWWRLANENK